MKLPVVPRRHPDEGLGSFLFRLAELNGWKGVAELFDACGIEGAPSGLLQIELIGEGRAANLLAAVGLGIDEIDQTVMSRLGPTANSDVIWSGKRIKIARLRRRLAPVCPECLAESPYYRRRWWHIAVTGCGKHGAALVDRCPSCRKMLRPGRRRIAQCNCGFDFTRIRAAVANATAYSTVDRWIESEDGVAWERYESVLFGAAAVLNVSPTGLLVSATVHYLTCGDTGLIDTILQSRPGSMHPRAYLMPLLVGQKAEQDFARRLLQHSYEQRALPTSGYGPVAEYGCRTWSLTDSATVLGCSVQQVKDLADSSLLEMDPSGKKRSLRVRASTINGLLMRLSSLPVSECGSNSRPWRDELSGGANGRSMSHGLLGVLSGNFQYGGLDPLIGLNSLKLSTSVPAGEAVAAPIEYITPVTAANRLAVHPEYVRSLAKVGLLRTVRGLHNALFVSEEDVENFHANYLFAGVLAKNLGQNPTNISEKLHALGVRSVSDERFDNLISKVFKRAEVSDIRAEDLEAIRSYPTRTGRPGKSASKPNCGVLVREAATALEITVVQVGRLCRAGVLVRAQEDSRVTEESFNDLCRRRNDPAYILFENAAEAVGETPQQFSVRWVKTGFVIPVDMTLWRFVAKADLARIAALKLANVCTHDAAQILSSPPCHILNLVKRGLLTPSHRVGKASGATLLFRREDVLAHIPASTPRNKS